jgi:hypothetical protein
MTEATMLRLHRELARIASDNDRIFQVIAPNRHNVSVTLLRKSAANATLETVSHDHHAADAVII